MVWGGGGHREKERGGDWLRVQPAADGTAHNMMLMPNGRREVLLKMKPTAVKWRIIEMKGHERVRASLLALTAATWVGRGRGEEGRVCRGDHDIKPSSLMFLLLFKGHFGPSSILEPCCRGVGGSGRGVAVARTHTVSLERECTYQGEQQSSQAGVEDVKKLRRETHASSEGQTYSHLVLKQRHSNASGNTSAPVKGLV